VGVLQFWFGVSRVAADRVQVTVAQGYLFPGRERTIPTGQIANVITKIGMQAGTTPYYDVVVVRKDGKPVIAGRFVRDKREAEWLVQTLKAALELSPVELTATEPPNTSTPSLGLGVQQRP
jgi:hypothetical protein